MGKKAEGDPTPEQRAAEQPPLDDDARWLPIEAAHQRRTERTGDNGLAIIDLMSALARGRLRCMARSIVTGERKTLKPATWTDEIMLGWSSYGVRIVKRPQPGPFPNIVKPLRGWRFYVWQPDLDRLWPPGGALTTVEPLRAIDRAKAVLGDLYPTKEQMPGVLKAATRAVAKECEKRGWKPPSEDRVQRAAEEIGYRPPRKRR